MTAKELQIYQAISQILTVFAETEVGANITLNNEVIINYLNSDDSIADYFDAHTEEDYFTIFTQHILAGYPVWRMLNLPDWTLKQLEKEFRTEVDRCEQARLQKYKCLTCKYLKEVECAFGVFRECTRPTNITEDVRHNLSLKRREPLDLKEVCEFYEQGTPNFQELKLF